MIKKERLQEKQEAKEWLLPPEHVSLHSGEVHVWRASLELPDPHIDELIAHSLSPDERVRSERYCFKKDRKQFVAARGILRNILARYLKTGPGRIVFSYDRNGKPSPGGPFSGSGISFNLSHASNLALYAVTLKKQVGIDLEHTGRELQFEDIVSRFFSPGEQEDFRAVGRKDRQQSFYTVWTRKEALLKAAGTGLSNIDNVDSARLPASAHNTEYEESFMTFDLDPGPGYTGALAAEGNLPRFTFYQWL